MLETFIKQQRKDPNTGQISEAVFANTLRRFVMTGILVPQRELAVAKIAKAISATEPSRSAQIPIQGPQDAKTEIYSLSGRQRITAQGVGLISTSGISTLVTGTGTKFATQTQVGDTIKTPTGDETVASITSDTVLNTVGNLPANVLASYFFQTAEAIQDVHKLHVEIFDSAWRRSLMNRDVLVTHVFGNNIKPMYLSESLFLELSQSFVMTFYNYDTARATSFAPICEGRKWQYEAQKRPDVQQFLAGLRTRKATVNPYWLTLDDGFVAVPANSSVTKFMTLTGDITAFLFNLYGSFDYLDGRTAPSPTLELFDAKTQRQMQGVPISFDTACGLATNPFVLPTPAIVEPQTQVMIKITNPTAVSLTVWLTFHGVAVYTGINWKGGALNDAHMLAESKKMYHEMSIPQIIPASPQS